MAKKAITEQELLALPKVRPEDAANIAAAEVEVREWRQKITDLLGFQYTPKKGGLTITQIVSEIFTIVTMERLPAVKDSGKGGGQWGA